MKFICTCILTITMSILFAQNHNNNHFPYLKRGKINDYMTFAYDPGTTKFLNLDCENPNQHWACKNIDGACSLVAVYKETYAILHCLAPNGTNYYHLIDKNLKSVDYFGGGDFYITGTGLIYTASWWNHSIRYKKFQIKTDTIVEEKQPFYYVGLKTKTNKNVTVYKTKNGNEVLANLPAKYDLEVLLEDNNQEEKYFLVRTDFGLVGWVRITDPINCPIDNLIIIAG